MLETILNLDYSLFTLINNGLSNTFFDIVLPILTDLQKQLYFKIIVIPFLIFLFLKKYQKKGILLFLMLCLCVGTSDFVGAKVKSLVQRERPQQTAEVSAIMRSGAGHYSFYSNHASNMFALATFMTALFPAAAIWLYSLAALVAFSRVYTGVHFPSDVICGALAGYIIGLLFIKIVSKINYLKEAVK